MSTYIVHSYLRRYRKTIFLAVSRSLLLPEAEYWEGVGDGFVTWTVPSSQGHRCPAHLLASFLPLNQLPARESCLQECWWPRGAAFAADRTWTKFGSCPDWPTSLFHWCCGVSGRAWRDSHAMPAVFLSVSLDGDSIASCLSLEKPETFLHHK